VYDYLHNLAKLHPNRADWCLDHAHWTYRRAPSDGSAWLSDDPNAWRVARGGTSSSINAAGDRQFEEPDHRSEDFGFRVVGVPKP
jgi:formylglycine-generating enzyme required for sulfatase activity